MSTAASNQTSNATVLDQKRILRTKVKSDLKSMDPAQRAQEDVAIQNIVMEATWYKSCEGLCAYISCSSLREVDTSNLLSDVLQTTNKVVTARMSAVNGLKSDSPSVGWGGRGGYVYQKAYVELFCSSQKLDALVEG